MAVVKAPALSMDASGNLGGICYSRWRGLSIARDPWTGTQPNTQKQVDQQNIMTSVSQSWGSGLIAAEREKWGKVARSIRWRDRFGSPYIPTGYQHFMKLNIRRLVMGLALMTTPPAVQELVYVLRLNLISNFPNNIAMRLVKTDALAPVDSYGVEYYITGPYNSGGRKPTAGEWRFLRRQVPPASFLYLNPIANKWYWFEGRQIAEFGDVGNWFVEQIQFI